MLDLVKVKVIPQQAELAHGIPGRLRLRIFLKFDNTRMVVRQSYVPVAFTPGEMVGPGNQTINDESL